MVSRFRVATTLARKIEELGVSPADVLRHAGLPTGLFDQEKILVSTEELLPRAPGGARRQVRRTCTMAIKEEAQRNHDALSPKSQVERAQLDVMEILRQIGAVPSAQSNGGTSP